MIRAGRSLDQAVSDLVALYREIAVTRMAGLPFLNPALSVEATGFCPFEGGAIGLLITPWFINAIFLPLSGDPWITLPVGTRITRTLPAGRYPFLVGREHALTHLSCSFFSPVQEFSGMDEAREVAREVLTLLLTPEPPSPGTAVQGQGLSRRELLLATPRRATK